MHPDLRNLVKFADRYLCSSELCQFILNRFKENLRYVPMVEVIRLGRDYRFPELVNIGVDHL